MVIMDFESQQLFTYNPHKEKQAYLRIISNVIYDGENYHEFFINDFEDSTSLPLLKAGFIFI